MKITIEAFSGASRALDPLKLRDDVGVDARNMTNDRSNLRPWKAPTQVATVPASPARKTIYRMGRDVPSDSTYWLSWTTVVDAIRAFNEEDTTERTIFTGSGTPKWTNNVIGLATSPYPTAVRELGVPAPTTTHLVAIDTDGPDGTAEDVFTVVTFVNDLGEEGAPGPVSAKVTVKPGALLDVTSLPAAPAGAYGLTHKRVYATKVGEATTDFYLAAEVTIATTAVTIDLGDLNDVLQTGEYDMPPADGHSLIELWNEFAAMISGKAVRFCEVGTIYAWPEGYRMPVGDKPVALGKFDQNILVLTTGQPYLITGQAPDAMSSAPISLDQSCVSKQSVVGFGFAVVWASPDGLWAMSSSGPVNLTDGLLTSEDWLALNPSTLVGVRHDGRYFGFFNDGSQKGFIIDPAKPQGITFLDTGYTAAFRDSITDSLYVLDTGGSIKKWDAGSGVLSAVFKSKIFHQAQPTTFGAAQVLASAYTGVTLKVWADGTLRYTRTVTGRKAFRLPQGFKANDWQFEITTQSPVSALLVASTLRELDA